MIVALEKLREEPIDAFSLLSGEDRDRLCRAAETDVSILLAGETGTGKGQLARALAARSARPQLVEVNCAALPDELLGSELFGHVRGAFTGAVRDRKGILIAAAGKTIFLDEIGEISLSMQRMLLRVVQRSGRTIKPMGADAEIDLPAMRFFFATNRDLEAEVRAGRFREDLLRRIDIVTVVVPPLRTRPELIPGYTARFLDELSRLHKIRVAAIDQQALSALEKNLWPGNVRELKNTLERALVTARRDGAKPLVLKSSDIRALGVSAGARRRAPRVALDEPSPIPADVTLAGVEEQKLRDVVADSGGSLKRAMAMLGVRSRSSMYSKFRKYGIQFGKVSE